jgi:hypothetical protein
VSEFESYEAFAIEHARTLNNTPCIVFGHRNRHHTWPRKIGAMRRRLEQRARENLQACRDRETRQDQGESPFS